MHSGYRDSVPTMFLGPWKVEAHRGRILGSGCSCQQASSCQFCRFTEKLGFPHMPDMIFPDNNLCLTHSGGGRIEFTALEALKSININREPVQVSCAEEWQESRSGTEQKVAPFDWTFTTDYKGSFHEFELTPTTDKINMDLLKKKDRILYYEDISLFEDELHDHGIASSTVKIRIMPSCWYILLRYFLRVDNVISRMNDTRMFYELNSPHVIIETTSRESTLPELNLPPHVYTDPNELAQHLKLNSQSVLQITLPSV